MLFLKCGCFLIRGLSLQLTIRCQASMTGGMIVRRRRQATTGWGIGSQSANTHPRRSRGPVGVFKTRILTLSDEKTWVSLMYFSKSLDRLILAPCFNDSQSVDVDAGFVVPQVERATTAYRTRIEASSSCDCNRRSNNIVDGGPSGKRAA